MVGKTAFIARLAVSNLIDTLSENDFFNVLYVSHVTNHLKKPKHSHKNSVAHLDWGWGKRLEIPPFYVEGLMCALFLTVFSPLIS